MQSITQSITQSKLLKFLSIPLVSVALSACGGDSYIDHDRIAKYNGNWQSSCSLDSNTGLSSLKTLYITDTEYTIFTDEFDNPNCFGSSDFITEVQGFLYYGDRKPDTSNFCRNTVEVDFVAAAIFEDGTQIPSTEISDYLNLPSNTLYDVMCVRNGELFTGDLSVDDGSTDLDRPLSLDYTRPLEAF